MSSELVPIEMTYVTLKTTLMIIIVVVGLVLTNKYNGDYNECRQFQYTMKNNMKSYQRLLYCYYYHKKFMEISCNGRRFLPCVIRKPCLDGKYLNSVARVQRAFKSERLKRDQQENSETNFTDVIKHVHVISTTFINIVTSKEIVGNKTFHDTDISETSLDRSYGDIQDDGRLYCNSSCDRYSCWPRTSAGTTATILCPSNLSGINAANNATKYCHQNGTWSEKAVYILCLANVEHFVTDNEISHLLAVRVIYNIGFWTSTIALLIALFIFVHFRGLRCLRNAIHCHLIVTFIVKNIVWIIMSNTITYVQHPSHSWLCKSLTSIYNFSLTTNFFWMFVEGLYLHIIIVWTLTAHKIRLRYLIIIGWGFPTIIIIIWVIVRVKVHSHQCWLPVEDHLSEDHYDYIFIGPIIFVLFANVVFLLTIVWVLITRLRVLRSLDTRKYRRAVKATIILCPLLGITYVLLIWPPSQHQTAKFIFKYINIVLQSFQGMIVAILYCFFNREVKSVIKKKWTRYTTTRL